MSYTKGDAAKDTGSSKGKTSAAWHDARDAAFGKGRNYNSGGDKGTAQNQAEARSIGRENGLRRGRGGSGK